MTDQIPHPAPPIAGADATLTAAIHGALDALLVALELEPLGDDRFRVAGEPGRFDRVFGGQTVAQALLAASATVADKEPQSLHAYFVDGGTPEDDVVLAVERVRDGRSMSTRHVSVRQGERTLLSAIASFHTNPSTPELADPPPPVAPPDQVPLLQQWAYEAPDALRASSRTWIDLPPPLELRMAEAPTFLGGPAGHGTRSHWMRLPRGVGDCAGMHTTLLAYASDYLLLDMAFRAHPERPPVGEVAATSLDHALWFHRPVRFDEWHLHTQRTRAVTGHRALVEGVIHDQAGHLVATAVQEVLVRPRR